MEKKIIFVDHGLANSFEDRIEINKELQKDPELFKYVLKHEQTHSNDPFDFNDFKQEFKFNKHTRKLLFFVLKRPKLWKEFLPIHKQNGIKVIDYNMFGMYLVLLFLIALNVFLFFKIF